MKLNRAEKITILAALLFIAALLGYWIGIRHIAGDYSVSVEHSVDTPPVQLEDGSPSDAPESYAAGLLNINIASEEDLTELPGIGAVLAKRIVEYRLEHGDFMQAEALMEVPGIGPGIYEGVKDYITVGG